MEHDNEIRHEWCWQSAAVHYLKYYVRTCIKYVVKLFGVPVIAADQLVAFWLQHLSWLEADSYPRVVGIGRHCQTESKQRATRTVKYLFLIEMLWQPHRVTL